MNVRIDRLLKKDYRITNKNGLEWGFIKVRSRYFTGREAVSFNRDGFIGFCGWASPDNQPPYMEAFKIWIDYMKKEKGITNA